MGISAFFSALYRFFARRRTLLFLATAALLGGAALAVREIRTEEDIVAMLPDDGSEAARDFRLLQQAPWTRKLVITLRREGDATEETLREAADRLCASLKGERIERVVAGPGDLAGGDFLPWLQGALPNLLTRDDLERIDPADVRRELEEGRARLLSPEGWGSQELLRSDPLGLHRLGLEKLRHLNMVPGSRVESGRFLSADGKSALLLADTSVPLTDSAGARELAAELERGAKGLPAGIALSWISGHRYTLANAEAIRRDLALVLSLSGAAVLAIYLVYLRSRWAFFVFLVPSSVLLLATGAISLLENPVFAVTLGFGGILLGIADEYAMQIYFGLRRGGADPQRIVGEISRPVLFSGLATTATMGVMLLSALPGQRQLAVFATAGIAAALLLSLVVLPHLVPPAPAGAVAPEREKRRVRLPRGPVLAVWALLLAASLWQGAKLGFDGDLRGMNLVTPEVREAEGELQRSWGNMRGRALAFVEGETAEEALAANEGLFAFLAPKLPAGEIVSLAPILPSPAAQAENRRSWTEFWRGERGRSVLAALRAEGEALGFAPDAFDPFLARLTSSPPAVDEAALRQAGLGEALDALTLREGGRVRLLTLLPDTPETLALFAGAPSGAHLVSQTRFSDSVSAAVGKDFARYLWVTSLVVSVLVALLFRHPRKVLLTLLPAATGLAVMLGAMGLLGMKFNLFNIVATVLVLGVSVDYGIYMVCKLTEGTQGDADRAVLVSGLTTLAGFGVLVLARHPALHSIGVTVLLGVGAAIPAALLVVPSLLPEEGR